MSVFTWTENQNSRKDLITETLLDCPSDGQQNTDPQKNCLCRQGKRKTRLQWKCIWSGTHIPAIGQESRRLHKGWEFSTQHRRSRDWREPGCAHREQMAETLTYSEPTESWKSSLSLKKYAPCFPLPICLWKALFSRAYWICLSRTLVLTILYNYWFIVFSQLAEYSIFLFMVPPRREFESGC